MEASDMKRVEIDRRSDITILTVVFTVTSTPPSWMTIIIASLTLAFKASAYVFCASSDKTPVTTTAETIEKTETPGDIQA